VTPNAEADAIELCIADDGAGMLTPTQGEREHHYGMISMRERAAMVNAALHVASVPGEGARVTVEIQT
jgi:nitrate/nitrite-specific signal transduction histidine kinase